jgi:hypothetical protein
MTTTSLVVVRFLQSVCFRYPFCCKTQYYLCIDNQPSSFNVLHDGRVLETSLANAQTEREWKVPEFDQKRPWGRRIAQNRISSWADPVSGRDILDGDDELGVGATRKKELKPSRLAEGSVVEDEDEGELVGDWSDGVRDTTRRTLAYDAQRCGCSH